MRRTRIMLVDDDPSARFLLRTILGDHPEFEVVAETGRASEAVDLLREHAPDVVLLDARMPLADGYEVAGNLREERPSIRLILLTSYVDDEVRSRAITAQIDATLDKGEFDAVPRVVREVVSREPGATAAPG